MKNNIWSAIAILSAAVPAAAVNAGDPVCADAGTVVDELRIAEGEGGFTGNLSFGDRFGFSLASLGDLDGDNVDDMIVGAQFTNIQRGAVWTLHLYSDGSVKRQQRIAPGQGGFTGALDFSDRFGESVAGIGDVDGDGVPDAAVGAVFDDDGGFDRGAVWILFLNADGTVKAHQKISSVSGGFSGGLDNSDLFGSSMTDLGDLDGDGVPDLAVGATGDDDGASNRGAVWILFLNADGTVKAHQKISDTSGGFSGVLGADDFSTPGRIGDLDGDGVTDLAVGARFTHAAGARGGAVWILFLNTDGTVRAEQKISEEDGGFTGALDEGDRFGDGVGGVGDIDGDGVPDLAVGASLDDDGGSNRGAVWILFLNPDGTVKGHRKISDTEGGFGGTLINTDQFGTDVELINGANAGVRPRISVGMIRSIGDEVDGGKFWTLSLDTCECFGDTDDDGVVDMTDLMTIVDAFNTFGDNLPGDLDGDGEVGFKDLNIVLSFFNTTCGS